MDEVLRISPEEVARYLGYRGNAPSDDVEALIERCSSLVLEAASPRSTFLLFPLAATDKGISLEGGLTLTGNDIAAHLSGCTEAAMFCATLSLSVDRLIARAETRDMMEGVVCDAAANTLIEAYCDKVADDIADACTGRFTTARYSPGYGDLPLALQPSILAVLDAQRRTGITVSPDLIMTPRKSVTAIIGVADKPLAHRDRDCRRCSQYETCELRRR